MGALGAFASVQAAAATDALTGLSNRRSFEDRVAQLRGQKIPFTVALCDLDHFKKLNDTHGHDTGDRALRLFAQVLRDTLRESDVVARFGGEEFAVVLPSVAIPQACEVLDRVRHALALAVRAGRMPPFTVSIGVADGEPAQPLPSAIESADRRLYLAKRGGRDRIVADDTPTAVVLEEAAPG